MDKDFYSCPQCGVRLAIPAGTSNVRITCPKCKFQFTVNRSDQSERAQDRPKTEAPEREAAPRSTTAAPKKKQGWKKWLLIVLAVLAAIGAYQNQRVKREAKNNPAPTATAAPIATAAPNASTSTFLYADMEAQIPAGALVLEYPDFDDYKLPNGDTDYEAYTKAKRRFFQDDLGDALRNFEQDIYILNVGAGMSEMWLTEDIGDYFWLDERNTNYPYLGRDEKDRSVTLMQAAYECTASELPAMERKLADAVARYEALVPAGADAWDTALAIHDALVRNVTYDRSFTGRHIYDLYGALVEGSAVCNGYSEAYAYLMKDLGYPTVRVYSEDHAWNRITYLPAYDDFVDPTWDDPDIADANGRPYVFHDFFGLRREEVIAIDSHAITSASGSSYTTFINPESEVVANYHKRTGCYLSSYDTGAIQSAFRQQLNAGENVLTVRFVNQADFQKALAALEDNSFAEIVANAGYGGQYWYWHNDNLQVIDIGINAE